MVPEIWSGYTGLLFDAESYSSDCRAFKEGGSQAGHRGDTSPIYPSYQFQGRVAWTSMAGAVSSSHCFRPSKATGRISWRKPYHLRNLTTSASMNKQVVPWAICLLCHTWNTCLQGIKASKTREKTKIAAIRYQIQSRLG